VEPTRLDLFDASGPALIRTLDFPRDLTSVEAVALSPDGKRLVCGRSDGAVCIWDLESGSLLTSAARHNKAVWCVAFSPDGSRVASVGEDHTTRLWDAGSGLQVASFDGGDLILSVAFSPDGSRLACGCLGGCIQVWDTVSGSPRPSNELRSQAVYSVSYSPDGSRIASGGRDEIQIWDSTKGVLLSTMASSAISVAFSPDSLCLLSGGKQTLRLCKVASGSLMATFHVSYYVREVAFSADGCRILCWSFKGFVTIFRHSCSWSTLCESRSAVSAPLSFHFSTSHLAGLPRLILVDCEIPTALPP